MEYVSDFTIEQFWKERYNLTPKGILKKAGAQWRHEVLNETFRHFTSSSFSSDGTFKTRYKNPLTGECKDKTHPGVTGFTSITSMKKLTTTLNCVQGVHKELVQKEKQQSISQKRMNQLKSVRNKETVRETSLNR